MRAYAVLRLPDGQRCELASGDIIGRMPTAALVLDDARVSEAHALVTLRAGELRLLPLRGRCAVDGELVQEAVLQTDMVIEPAPGLELLVEAVVLPTEVLALQGQGLARQVLGNVVSVRTKPVPELLPRYVGDAAAHLWARGSEWRLQVAGQPVQTVGAGDSWTMDGLTFEIVAVSLDTATLPTTRVAGGHHAPLRIVARFDAVHIHRSADLALVLDGLAARLLSELVASEVPVSWEVLAAELWSDDADRASLRRRWDVLLARLRRKLRMAGLPSDLVRAGGNGLTELLLRQGDTVVNET
jgi:hypothetical protein